MKSLNGKFLLIVMPPVIISTLILIVLNGLFTYRDMQKNFSIAISNFAASQSSALAIHLWNYDEDGLLQCLNTLTLYPGISKAVVYNTRNAVMAAAESPGSSHPSHQLQQVKQTISFKTPYKEQHLGNLTVFYHFHDQHSRLLTQLVRNSALLMLLLVLMIVAGAVVANRLIIGIPLQRLMISVRKTDSLSVHEPVDWPAKDEMGRSIAAYNALLANLTAKEASLRQSELKLTGTLSALQERERTLATLLGNLPGMAYRCNNNRDWRMEFVSEGCFELTGYPSSALLENTVISYNELIHSDDRGMIWAQVQRALKQKRPFQLTYRIIAKNGLQKWMWEKGEGVLTKNGELIAIEGFISDISEIKYAEESLKQAKAAAEKAKKAADAANQAKSAFLASMSHELRTPMNAILGFSQLIQRDQTLDPEHQEHLSIIQRSGEHLLTLINEVLDMSKIEAGKMTLNKNSFDFRFLLDDLKNMLGIKADKKNISLHFDIDSGIPRYISTDEAKLRQVLINLIGNAIKFTEKGGVQLSVNSEQLSVSRMQLRKSPNADHCSLSTVHCLKFIVKDTGPGIAPEEIDSLFEAFAQTQTGRQSQEGTGLGLAVSQKFVQIMGGDISVQSEVGKGTAFVFNISVHSEEAENIIKGSPARRPVSIESGQIRKKILIADDTLDNRKLLFKLFEPFGFELREAADGQEAVEIWQKWHPDLIWMDIRMPVMDGYEAVRMIRKIENSDPKRPKTVIIAQTASSFDDERSRVLDAGCDNFLRKPFKESDVFELMHRHLGVRFVYEEIEAENGKQTDADLESGPAGSEDFADIPFEILKKLKLACTASEMEEVNDVIHEIKGMNSALADKLEVLADEFEYGIMVEIIEKVLFRIEFLQQ